MESMRKNKGNKNIRPPPRARQPAKRRRISNDNVEEKPPNKSTKTILSWLIDKKIIHENEEVLYNELGKKRLRLTGRITREGLFCQCCKRILNVYEFEEHGVAYGIPRNPYCNIILAEKKISLFSCMERAWLEEKQNCKMFVGLQGVDDHDDACIICADGGDLLCCENCSSTYHPACMNMEMVPRNDWYCPYCVCSHCGVRGNRNSLEKCCQCEKQFHFNCAARQGVGPKNYRIGAKFCGHSCEKIFYKLREMVAMKKNLEGGFSCSIIHCNYKEAGVKINDKHKELECKCKVAIAWQLMNESFDDIIDRHTQINLTKNVLYNCRSSYRRLNFGRFYTAILEKGDEVISSASLRIHGNGIAEMPFIATDFRFRKQGMCGKLLHEIESMLRSMNVECLVIPSSIEKEEFWRSKHNFNHVESPLMQKIMNLNILAFLCTVRLGKSLVQIQGPKTNQSKISSDHQIVEVTKSNERLPFDVTETPREAKGEDLPVIGRPITGEEEHVPVIGKLIRGDLYELSRCFDLNEEARGTFDLNAEPEKEDRGGNDL